MKAIWSILISFGLVALILFILIQQQVISLPSVINSNLTEEITNQTDVSTNSTLSNQTNKSLTNTIQVVATNLTIPWEIVFLSDESLLVTQRPGTLLRVMPDSQEQIEVSGVEHVGEGGLLGLALHPDFEENNWLYLYLTTARGNGLINRVERYSFDIETNKLSNQQTIISNIPGAQFHDGGRIAFGPDGLLYITTGDATQEQLAQDTQSLAGKILRLNDDGSIPSDNPFNNAVYSYGHRNPQGLAWDEQGRLWATEHGPSGIGSGFDEVNLIEPGNNYGWPIIQGDESEADLITPVIQSGANDTWAPAAAEVVNNSLYFVGLRGEALYVADIDNDRLTNFRNFLKNDYGRLRIVKTNGQGWLYLATSNQDGRGRPKSGDDKIIRVRIDSLE